MPPYCREQEANSRHGFGYRGERAARGFTGEMVGAVIEKHLQKSSIEDLVFGRGFSKDDDKCIKTAAFEYKMKAGEVQVQGAVFLVLSCKVKMQDVTEQLVREARKVVHCGRTRYELINSPRWTPEACLRFQGDREGQSFPRELQELNKRMEVREQERKEKAAVKELRSEKEAGWKKGKTDGRTYKSVKYVYSVRDDPVPRPKVPKENPAKTLHPSTTRYSEKKVSHPPDEHFSVTVLRILEGRKKGAWAKWIEKQYEKESGEELPRKWAEEMEGLGLVRRESSGLVMGLGEEQGKANGDKEGVDVSDQLKCMTLGTVVKEASSVQLCKTNIGFENKVDVVECTEEKEAVKMIETSTSDVMVRTKYAQKKVSVIVGGKQFVKTIGRGRAIQTC